MLPAAGAVTCARLTRIVSVTSKHPLQIVPVTVTGTASPSATVSSTAARLNLTVRSGRPSPSASPSEVGAEGSTGTLPFRRIEAMSMSAGEAGGSGSSVAVTQRPIERKLSVFGMRAKLIGVLGQLGGPVLSSTVTVLE